LNQQMWQLLVARHRRNYERSRAGAKSPGRSNEEETAEVLQVSPRAVRREWSLARAWLHRELSQREQDEA